MPIIAKFYLRHCIIGFCVAASFVATLLYLNVANLWHLVSTSDVGIMAVVVFWILNGIVFASVQTAIAVMMMAEDEDDAGGPRRGTAVLVPAEVTRSR